MDDLGKRLLEGVQPDGEYEGCKVEEADELMEEAAARITELEASSRSSFTRGAEAMKEMAAREADLQAKRDSETGQLHPLNSDSRGRCFARSRAATELAQTIRALPTPEQSV